MGSIQVENPQQQVQSYTTVFDSSKTCRLDHGYTKTFKSLDLGLDERDAVSSGIRDEIILLSWLLVLLRTQGYDGIMFEWAHKSPGHEPIIRSLKMDEVVTSRQSKLADIVPSIASSIRVDGSGQSTSLPTGGSLLLSTSSLSQIKPESTGQVHKNSRIRSGRNC
jgi:fusarinine C synthase